VTPADPRPDCILWTGKLMANRYAVRGRVLVHREVLEQKLGRPIAPGMDTCHTCDVRHCINPDHLYEGTRAQNMQDARDRGRLVNPRGEQHPKARLSDQDVRDIRRLHDRGVSYDALGARYGISPRYAYNLCTGHCSRRVA